MSAVLLDTTVASLLHPKRKGSEIRAKYEPYMEDMKLLISFQTVAELWKWAEENNWGDKMRTGLEAFINRFIIIPYSDELAKEWARVSVLCQQQGRRLTAGDAWIVATARRQKIPLLTHDKDMIGLEIPRLEVVSYVGEEG